MENVVRSLGKFETIIVKIADKMKSRLHAQKKRKMQQNVQSLTEPEISENIVTSSGSPFKIHFPIRTLEEISNIENDDYAEIAISYISSTFEELNKNFQLSKL